MFPDVSILIQLAIGGWSQGGFLTAWGVSQTKNKFRCGVMGAGVSDWGSLTTESDMPDFEVLLHFSRVDLSYRWLGGPWGGSTVDRGNCKIDR